jgi:hypothetical protein
VLSWALSHSLMQSDRARRLQVPARRAPVLLGLHLRWRVGLLDERSDVQRRIVRQIWLGEARKRHLQAGRGLLNIDRQ